MSSIFIHHNNNRNTYLIKIDYKLITYLSQVYSINVSGTIVQQNISIGGSGSSYLYGFMDSQYKDGMTQQECENLVLNGKLLLINTITLL